MPWPEKRLESWQEFQALAAKFSEANSPFQFSYLFRGQSRAEWGLAPSLHRTIRPDISAEDALDIENRLQLEFFAQAGLHLPPQLLRFGSNELWDRWALMQHYSAPTRLLDWTLSPYVAAYFAVEGDWDVDGMIWVVHAMTLMLHTVSKVKRAKAGKVSECLTPDAQPWLTTHRPGYRSERVVAQQGAFTVCYNILGKHDELIEEACASEQKDGSFEVYGKLIVSKEDKPTFLHNLHSMNVAASSLFPGADGLGRSMRELAALTKQIPIEEVPKLEWRHDGVKESS